MTTLVLRCRCGAVQGTVRNLAPRRGNRSICLCDDCQAYATWLGRGDLLDRWGGTDIVPVLPADLDITAGADRLGCVRLSDRGMLRWYAACCHTPIANQMASPRMPFAGLFRAVFDAAHDEAAIDAACGPIRGVIMARASTREVPPHAHPSAPFPIIFAALKLLARGFLTGGHRPHPFVDPATGRPWVEPRVLSPAERDALRPAPNG